MSQCTDSISAFQREETMERRESCLVIRTDCDWGTRSWCAYWWTPGWTDEKHVPGKHTQRCLLSERVRLRGPWRRCWLTPTLFGFWFHHIQKWASTELPWVVLVCLTGLFDCTSGLFEQSFLNFYLHNASAGCRARPTCLPRCVHSVVMTC